MMIVHSVSKSFHQSVINRIDHVRKFVSTKKCTEDYSHVVKALVMVCLKFRVQFSGRRWPCRESLMYRVVSLLLGR